MKTAILGGGLSGLTLGYLLKQEGGNFEILEKENECGGLMRTLQEDGFTFDYGGSHIIFSQDKEVLDFMVSLLGDNKVRNRRNTKILYRGHYVKYPFENGLADLPKQDNFECLYYFIQNLIEKERGEQPLPENFKQWCYYTFGKGIAEKYLIPYNEKIWDYPLERMSLAWVDRIPNPPAEDIIKSSLGINTEGYTHQLYFYYPKMGGIQALIKSIEEKNKEHIVTNFEVTGIKRKEGKWVISNREDDKEYDKIVSTIPIFDLVAAINAPKEVEEAALRLKYNSLVAIMIGLNTPNINELSWLYIPDKDVLPHRVSFSSNYSDCVAPDGKSSVLAEITCSIGDEVWEASDEDIAKTTIDDLDRLGIIKKDETCFVKVKRTKYAYVISDLNYQENLGIINDYIEGQEISLLGRFAEFKYMNMDACIRHAMNYAVRQRGA